MSLADKMLRCMECGQTFAFTVAEQEFHESRGYTNEPKRCPTCREARRGQRGLNSRSDSYSYRAQREMYPAVCASCGKETEVPFQPRQGRPVYCSNCFSRSRPTTMGRR
ncbi:MAG: zinc-ribbon domain containing protein [Chloroflexi bacterium]|nr:zinc-ribbon domain containing protein [Chloroflexota bacterium]